MSLYYLILSGIFALFFAADVVGHRKLAFRRSGLQKLLATAVAAGCLVSAYAGVSGLLSARTASSANRNLAYRYLADGNADAAREKAESGGGNAAVELAADALDRDYLSAYFAAERLCAGGSLAGEDLAMAQEIRSLAAGALNIHLDADGKPASGEADLSLGSALDAQLGTGTATVTVTETDRHKRVTELARQLASRNSGSAADSAETDRLYALDSALRSDNVASLGSAKIEQLLQDYPDSADVQRLAAVYFARTAEYDRALGCAASLLQRDSGVTNCILYTDIVAQQAAKGNSASSSDEEAQKLTAQAKQLSEQAAETDTSSQSGADRAAELKVQAQDLLAEAARLPVKRAINYLLSKEPLSGDSTGMLDLQLAKLYLAAGDRSTAKTYIWKVIGRSGSISDSSPIKQALGDVAAAVNQLGSSSDFESPLLSSAIERLVRAQSSGAAAASGEAVSAAKTSVFETPKAGVLANAGAALTVQNTAESASSSSSSGPDADLKDCISSTVKYDRLSVFVSSVDVSEYPKVRVKANVSGEKNGIFGLASEYGASDFALTDTQYDIRNFSLVKDTGADQVSIALALDCSGSMSGTAISNAKQAAEACASNMNPASQKMALVSYNTAASVPVSLTSSSAELISGIRGLTAAGGTNIPGALDTAVEAVGSSGTRAVILMTDGLDNGGGDIEKSIANAVSKKIAVYTVGLGSVNTSYLQNIASETGGRYISADSSGELADIYLLLQKYIVNNYCFEYTITENPKTDPRSATVEIPAQNVDDTKAYRISGEPVDNTETDTGIYPVSADYLALYSLSPASASADSVRDGITITLKGSGFVQGMTASIGSVALSDVKVRSIGEATAYLKGTLAADGYTVQVHLPDGRAEKKKDGFRVFRAGTVTSVQIGDMTVLADSIGITNEAGTATTLVASGNVSINGFLQSTGALTIKPTRQLTEDELKQVGSKPLYLGATGTVSGSGKLYVSYAQAEKTVSGGSSFKQMIGRTFTQNIMGGKDLLVRDGTFSVTVGEDASSFGDGGSQQSIAEEQQKYSLKVPFLAEMDMKTVTLYADRLQLDISALDPSTIEDNLISSLTGGVTATQKSRDSLQKTLDKYTRFSATGSMSIALGAADMRWGGEVKLSLPSDKKFSFFGIKELSIKTNSLDPDYEYWHFGVKVVLPGVTKLLSAAKKEDTLSVEVGSYFQYPDSLTVENEMDPGIKVFKVVNITKVGGGISGISNWFVQDDTVEKKDWVAKVTASADVNVFKMLGWPATGAGNMKAVTRWGELGSIDDATVKVNFTKKTLDISADLSLLQQKVASAEIGIAPQKLLIDGNVGGELSAAGIDVSGSLELKITSQWQAGSSGGTSTALMLEGKVGRLKCGWAHLDVKEQSASITLSVDADNSSGQVLILAELEVGNNLKRVWYDSTGATLFDKVHYESDNYDYAGGASA